MRRILPLFLGMLVSCRHPDPVVVMRTAAGDMTLEIFARSAPLTSTNFLSYVDEGRFEGAVFYRVVREDNQPGNAVKIGVIQGGMETTRPEAIRDPIPHETTEITGVLHRDGTLSMARAARGRACGWPPPGRTVP